MLEEGRGTCSTKHALLASAAAELGLDVALTVGIYDMSEANTPGVGAVLALHGLASIPEAHCYLVARGRRIDVTRSGVDPVEPIRHLHAEWTIRPDQIGEHKIALHRDFLGGWLRGEGAPGLGLEAVWAIRESCIRAIAQHEG